jgi:hypothetical protein
LFETRLLLRQGQINRASESLVGFSPGSSVPAACVFAAASESAAGVAVLAFVCQLHSYSGWPAVGAPGPLLLQLMPLLILFRNQTERLDRFPNRLLIRICL